MPRVRYFIASLALGASFLIAGCTDLPTAPTPEVAEPSYLLGGVLQTVGGVLGGGSGEGKVLERRRALAQDEVDSRWIGPRGGALQLRNAGLTVYFPPNAVSRWTRITVTAPAGDLVGYHFEPHGLEFNRQVTVVQDMLKTEGLGLLGLSVAYFEGDLEPSVTALESLTLRILGLLGIFRIEHFSGYVIATN
jgi:hypothetical protein